MRKLRLLITALVLFTVNGYSQSAGTDISKAKNSYKKGNYVDACFESIKALRIKPNSRKPQEILSISYELAVESINEEIDELKARSKSLPVSETLGYRIKIVNLYKELIKLDRKAYEITKIIKRSKYDLEFDRIDVKFEYAEAKKLLNVAKEKAAEKHYEKGLSLMNVGGRENSKKAAKEFRLTKMLLPGYKESEMLYKKMRKAGTSRVTIFSFENKSGFNNFGAIGESVSDQLASNIFDAKMEFVEIVSREELDRLRAEHNLNSSDGFDKNTVAKYGQLKGVHVIVTGKITQASYKHQNVINDNPYQVSKRVVVGQEPYINSKGKQRTRSVFGDVYAKVYEHKKSSSAFLSGSYKVIDVETGKILKQEQFNEVYKWQNKWITFSGDERAIMGRYPGYDRTELSPPTDFEMANNLVQSLAKKMSMSIIDVLR